jgi:hypothetical protein
MLPTPRAIRVKVRNLNQARHRTAEQWGAMEQSHLERSNTPISFPGGSFENRKILGWQ